MIWDGNPGFLPLRYVAPFSNIKLFLLFCSCTLIVLRLLLLEFEIQVRTSQSVCWSSLSLHHSSHTFTLKVRVHCYGYSCVYNSCRVGCNVDDRRLAGDTLSQANSAVSNFVGLCYRYWRRPCYRIHTRQLFVCGLANFDCIMYSKTSDKPEITDTGNGLKWHRTVKWGTCDLILERQGDVCLDTHSCWPCFSSSCSFSLLTSQYLVCWGFSFWTWAHIFSLSSTLMQICIRLQKKEKQPSKQK